VSAGETSADAGFARTAGPLDDVMMSIAAVASLPRDICMLMPQVS
jgi:hypothetical protein